MKPRQPAFSKIYAAHDNAEERAEYARITWAEALAELQDADLVTKSRVNILKRYVELRVEYEFYYSQATFEGPVQIGPNGGEVFSMKWAALLKIQDQLMKLEDSLLISPKAAGNKIEKKAPKTAPTAADEFLSAKAH